MLIWNEWQKVHCSEIERRRFVMTVMYSSKGLVHLAEAEHGRIGWCVTLDGVMHENIFYKPNGANGTWMRTKNYRAMIATMKQRNRLYYAQHPRALAEKIREKNERKRPAKTFGGSRRMEIDFFFSHQQ
jgi:hypothetical protein